MALDSFANVLVLCSLLCLAQSRSQSEASLKLSDPTDLATYPWQVSMVMDGSNFCGGSIISDTWILSSGSCAGYRSYVITAGSASSFGGTEASKQLFLTTESYRHPQFSGKKFYDNDISLLHLQQQIQFGQTVSAVQLPSYTMALGTLEGEATAVSGWGRVSDGAGGFKVASTLSSGSITIADNSVCRTQYGNLMISNKYCSTSTPCDMMLDQGSALTYQNGSERFVVGIVSGVPSVSCAEGLPLIITRVDSFLGFIESTTDIAVAE